MTQLQAPTSTCKVLPLGPDDNPLSTCSPLQIPAFQKPAPPASPPASKVRRDLVGGRRGQGHRLPPVRRFEARRLRRGRPDPSLSSFGGLVDFNVLVDECGADAALRSLCAPLKTSPNVVYPLHAQVRLLLDLLVAGGTRVFDLEAMAADPLLVLLAGGRLCCLDTLYTDLERFDETARQALSALVTEQGLAALRGRLLTRLHVDIDPSVCPVFGDEIEGAVPGYNHRYHGRNSYHPLLARVAETGTLLGAQLRPGNTAFGKGDAVQIGTWLDALRSFLGDSPCLVVVRMDKGGDSADLMKCIDDRKMLFVVKARLTAPLVRELLDAAVWTTTDRDANDKPTQQIAEIDFVRDEWRALKLPWVRVLAVRSTERQGGMTLDESGLTVQVILTNDRFSDAEDVVQQYDGRAGIEPLIAEMKQAWGLEKVSSKTFAANEALLLLKGLAHNLLRRLVRQQMPTAAQRWKTTWVRRWLILRPARVVRTGRRVVVRLGGLPTEAKRE